jgi:hypothetical protein
MTLNSNVKKYILYLVVKLVKKKEETKKKIGNKESLYIKLCVICVCVFVGFKISNLGQKIQAQNNHRFFGYLNFSYGRCWFLNH